MSLIHGRRAATFPVSLFNAFMAGRADSSRDHWLRCAREDGYALTRRHAVQFAKEAHRDYLKYSRLAREVKS